ncbi:glucosyltransferase domain-containing protein [Petroclostridium sp. X23]|uniref:glucosyltransferase domain-containing protein n=1 Tax=Petroclostridium sp. X23 TaxID=3045146 RepID=UPI0024AD393F|nr:glucosyltransferase domain-containing protein [Petroclostridium sp. X23]WHH58376.1 glucosyltransferase domain-containing protein [Petroclostridium sp. X23]
MNKLQKRLNVGMFWIVLFGLVLVKYGYYGFRYFPVIDDWIQYGGYPLYEDIFKDVILRVGTYTTRPLASLSDPYIWGQMWEYMWAAFLIITILHFISAWLLYKVFAYNKMPVSMIFAVIYLLLPLGSEATYWISASSRIVVGMFFMALSLYLLSLHIHVGSGEWGVGSEEKKQNTLLAGFALTHLASFGYYEQVIILSFVSALLVIILNWSRVKNKWIVTVPFINLFIIGAYYKFFGNTGNLAQRGQVVDGKYIEHFNKVIDKISDVWGRAHLPLYTNGFRRGIEVLFHNHSYFYMILILLMSSLACLYVINDKTDKNIKKNLLKIAIGLLLFWVPFGVNFLLKDIWISNRNAFTSFIGLGLMAEGMISTFNGGKIINYIKGLGIFAAVFIFLIVNVSELTDYKSISEIDRKICSNVVSAIQNKEFYKGRKSAIVFGTRPVYIEQNMYFHEHIHNVTESDWAFTGGVRAIAGNVKIQSVKPMHKWHAVSLKDDIWSKNILLGIDNDLSVFPLKAASGNNGDILLSKRNGDYFGQLEKQGNGTYVLQMP